MLVVCALLVHIHVNFSDCQTRYFSFNICRRTKVISTDDSQYFRQNAYVNATYQSDMGSVSNVSYTQDNREEAPAGQVGKHVTTLHVNASEDNPAATNSALDTSSAGVHDINKQHPVVDTYLARLYQNV